MPRTLSQLEQSILAVIADDPDNAVGADISRSIPVVSLPGVYQALERMSAGGLIRETSLPPRGLRGGRRRTLYTITDAGIIALRDTLRHSQQQTVELTRSLQKLSGGQP